MKIFDDIPIEEYDNAEYCYDYLQTHDTIGNEEANYNGVFHVHWRGSINNDKIILQLKSILGTQDVDKIYFWIENPVVTELSPSYYKLKQLKKYVEVKVFDESVMMQASGNKKYLETIWNYYSMQHKDYRYRTDILRWIVLNIYGGVYTDLDMFLLKDLRKIKINRYSSKWPLKQYAIADILKLEKGNEVYEEIFLNNPKNPKCFLMMLPPLFNPEAYNFKHDNLKFSSLPTFFFDPVFIGGNQGIEHILNFNKFDLFLKPTNKDVTLENIFPGCFGYHTHWIWDGPELKNSFAGRLNKQLDDIIQEKYGIKPFKIFQG